MENLGAVLRLRQAGDRGVLLVGARITLRGDDDGQSRLLTPFGAHLIERARSGGVQQGQKIAFQPHHQDLAFRIAEADIVFDQFRPPGGDHQAGEEYAAEGMAALSHAAHRRLDDLLHRALDQSRRHHRGRRIGAHTAGVRTGIAVADTLVVLGRCQRQRRPAVAEAEEARFLAVEEGFDHDFRAGRAKSALEAVVDGGQRLVQRHGDGDALAGRQPVRLDDDRGALLADIGLGLRRVVEALVGAGRDVIFGAEILGETFRTLQLGGGRRWPEGGDACGAQPVGETGDQRRLRADDDEIDGVFGAEAQDRGVVLDVHGHERRHLGDAGIAGRRIQRAETRRLRKLPGERMLAAAGSDQQNFHRFTLPFALSAG